MPNKFDNWVIILIIFLCAFLIFLITIQKTSADLFYPRYFALDIRQSTSTSLLDFHLLNGNEVYPVNSGYLLIYENTSSSIDLGYCHTPDMNYSFRNGNVLGSIFSNTYCVLNEYSAPSLTLNKEYVVVTTANGGGLNCHTHTYQQCRNDLGTAGAYEEANIILGTIPTNTITLTSPPNNSTTTDFNLGFWHGKATLTSTSTLDDGFRAGLDLVYCDITRGCLADLIEQNTLFFDTTGTISWGFDKKYVLNAGDTYSVYARLRAAPTPTSTILAISATSTFTITTPITPSAEVCQPPAGGLLDYPVDNITYATCKAFYFLFVPNDTQQNDIKNYISSITGTIKEKPPIGYFYLIKDAFGSLSTTTTSTILMTSSTYQAFSGVFNPLRSGLGFIFYFAGGVWIYHRIRNLEI